MADQPTMTPQMQTSYNTSPSVGMAVAALVCGILGFCFPPLGLVGLILGIIAVIRASSDPVRHGGKGMAIGGICTGGFSLVFMGPLMVAILLPSFARARELARRTACQANMRPLSMAFVNYTVENNGDFPDDPAKALARAGISAKNLECPSSGGQSNYRYVPGWSTKDGANKPLVYEPIANHGDEGVHVLFLDGHTEWVEKTRWAKVVEPYEDTSVPISPP
jgi:prepilin-type processing-associated H-X9-DG protein